MIPTISNMTLMILGGVGIMGAVIFANSRDFGKMGFALAVSFLCGMTLYFRLLGA